MVIIMEILQAQINLDVNQALQELVKINTESKEIFSQMSKNITDALGKIDGKSAGKKVGEDVAKEGKQSGVGFGDLFRSSLLANLASSGIQTAFSKLFDFGGGQFKLAADLESTRMAFNGIIGDATKAGDIMGQVVDFAAKTPFEIPELAESAKMLAAFGVTADNIIPTIKSIGDVSAGLNVPVKEMSYLVGTIQTQGKAMTADLNQFANRGVPIWKVLGEMTGKTNGELRKMAESGEISSDLINQAFTKMSSKGGAFFDMMNLKSNTMNGRLSTLSDTFGGVGRRILGVSDTGEIIKGQLFDKISNGIVEVTKILSNMDFAPIGKAIGDTIKFVSDNFSLLSSILGGIVAGGTVAAVSSGIAALSTALAAAGGVAGVFGSVMAFAFAPLTLIVVGVGLVVAGLLLAWQTNFMGIREITNSVFSFIGSFIQSSWSATVAFLTSSWETIKSVWNAGTKLISDIWNKVWETIKSFVSAVFLSIIAIFTGNSAQLGTIWEAFGEKLKSIWSATWEAVKKFFADAWTSIDKTLDDLKNGAKTKIDEAGESIKKGVSDAWEFVKNIDVGQIAKDMMDGFVNGIKNGIGGVMDAMKNMAGSAVQAAKDNLQIKSPSRVMIEIGQNVGDGMVTGIENSTSNVNEVMTKMTKAVVDNLKIQDIKNKLAQMGTKSFGFSQMAVVNDGKAPTNPQIPTVGNPTQNQTQNAQKPQDSAKEIDKSFEKTNENLDKTKESLESGLAKALDKGAEALKTALTKMDEQFTELANMINENWIKMFTGIGGNIPLSLLGGMAQNEKSLYDAIGALSDSALSAVKIEKRSREEFGEKGRGAANSVARVLNPNVELMRNFKPYSGGNKEQKNEDNSRNVNISNVNISNNQGFDAFQGQINGLLVVI